MGKPPRNIPKSPTRPIEPVPERPSAALRYEYPVVEPEKVRFLMSVSKSLADRLEAERAKRGLRSRAETIRVLLEEALK